MELQVFKRMSGIVADFLGNKEVESFEKAYHLAVAVENLRELLTHEYMAPIMKLQGSRLGFRTDKDRNDDGSKGKGYPVEIVKECLIEAVLMGVQPVGNQFNIIASGAYITKEGYGHLLKNLPGLDSWKITHSLPRIQDEKAAIVMTVEYTQAGVKALPVLLDFPIRVNKRMGTDAVIGKAERKARAWLHKTVTGSETPEGDVLDTDATILKTTLKEEIIDVRELDDLYVFKKDKLTEEERVNATRIINNKETNSYAKLKKLLDGK